jgi:hypothetical protein
MKVHLMMAELDDAARRSCLEASLQAQPQASRDVLDDLRALDVVVLAVDGVKGRALGSATRTVHNVPGRRT